MASESSCSGLRSVALVQHAPLLMKLQSAAFCLSLAFIVSFLVPLDLCAQSLGQAQQGQTAEASDTEALAKEAQNPIANLITVPFQNNTGFGVGQYDRTQNVLNIQPVIPVRINENWNMIVRAIFPISWQPNTQQPTQGWFGLGDFNPTFFFSPSKAEKLTWGVGPAFVVPTATADQLGQGKLSVGPGLVLLTKPGHWLIGTFMNNVWSVAGSGSRPPVNQMLLQYFINYNLKKGWYIVTSPINTADWRASSGNQWVVPLGGGVGRIVRLGEQPANLQLQFFGNAVHPEGASPWGMRVQIQLLYPKKPKS